MQVQANFSTRRRSDASLFYQVCASKNPSVDWGLSPKAFRSLSELHRTEEMVPTTGLEPVRCYSLEPESSASANSATWATPVTTSAMTALGTRLFSKFPLRLAPRLTSWFWRAEPRRLGSPPELSTTIGDSCSRRLGILHQAAKPGHGFVKFKARSSMKLRGSSALFEFPEYHLGTETINSDRSRYRCRRSWGFEPNGYHGSLPNGSMARGSECSLTGI